MSFIKLKYFYDIRIFSFSFLLIIIQACSNSPVGIGLSRSFDLPENQKGEEKKLAKKANLQESEIIISPSEKKVNIQMRKVRQVREKERKRLEEKKQVFKPQPYRIIIKLSAANPSAPAETVTKALRTAGVEFEVEMIELIDNKKLKMESSRERVKR